MKNTLVSGVISELTPVSKIESFSIKPITRTYFIAKQVVDIVGAGFGLILALPLIFILVLVIAITTKGSVIYSHERLGRDGKPFQIYKFRSMKKNAEPEGPQLASRNDPRVTRVGRFMRRWRLDEIPNLINVLKGEMSLIGPRPERKYYVDQIVASAPEYSRLLKYKPGVTSLGEVAFGYAENVEEMIVRMKYDLQYIENISIAQDLNILARSVIVILRGKGV